MQFGIVYYMNVGLVFFLDVQVSTYVPMMLFAQSGKSPLARSGSTWKGSNARVFVELEAWSRYALALAPVHVVLASLSPASREERMIWSQSGLIFPALEHATLTPRTGRGHGPNPKSGEAEMDRPLKLEARGLGF